MLLTKLSLALAGLLGGLGIILLAGAVIAGNFWLPDDQIAYVSYRELSPDIYLIDLTHDLSYNLTRHPAYDVAPAWSPNGEWLAFASDRDGRRNIYVMDRVGRNLRRLTRQGGIYTQPRWSSDGQRVIFIALDEAPNGLYSINFDGSNLQNLLAAADTPSALTLDLGIEAGSMARASSPDGSHTAFMSFRNQSWGIYLARDVSRRDARLLIAIGYPAEAPVWSPDGRRMAFIAQLGSTTDLYVIGVDAGSQPRRLTASRSFEASPVWRPS